MQKERIEEKQKQFLKSLEERKIFLSVSFLKKRTFSKKCQKINFHCSVMEDDQIGY
jgi:hypothetical protein